MIKKVRQPFSNLTREEKEFLKKYGIEEDNISRDALGRLTNHEKVKSNIHNSNLMNAIKKKMDLNSFSPIYHTSHIPLEVEGRFYLEHDEYAPIELYKSLDNFQLWEVKLHRNSSRMRKGARGKIVLEYYNVNYGFNSEVLDTFHLDKDYIKTPHSHVSQLTKRKNPRIKTDFEAILIYEDKTFPAKVADLSLSGAKIEVKNNGLLVCGLEVTIKTRINNKEYMIDGKIIYAGLHSVGILFTTLPEEIRHFIERELKLQNIENSKSHQKEF